MDSAEPAPRRRALFWLALGALLLVLLAAGLGSFTLQPGRSFQAQPTPVPTAAPPGGLTLNLPEWVEILYRAVLAVMILLLPVSLIYALTTKEGRRRLIMNIILVGLFLLMANQFQKIVRQPREEQGAPMAGDLSKLPPGEPGEPLPLRPAGVSDTVVMAASIGVVLALGGLAFWFGRRLLRPPQLSTFEQLAEEAEQARRDLDAGDALEDVVVRCYRNMSRLVAEARDLRRARSATPQEFAGTLASAGLPPAPLHTLTRLFEEVRYGGLTPGAAERQSAVDSLEAIAAACRKGGE